MDDSRRGELRAWGGQQAANSGYEIGAYGLRPFHRKPAEEIEGIGLLIRHARHRIAGMQLSREFVELQFLRTVQRERTVIKLVDDDRLNSYSRSNCC